MPAVSITGSLTLGELIIEGSGFINPGDVVIATKNISYVALDAGALAGQLQAVTKMIGEVVLNAGEGDSAKEATTKFVSEVVLNAGALASQREASTKFIAYVVLEIPPVTGSIVQSLGQLEQLALGQIAGTINQTLPLLNQAALGPIVTPGFNCLQTVISQYANSPILLTIIENFCANVDQTNNLNNFYLLIWNIDTAIGYGLDVWGRIVGVTRTLKVADEIYFGFAEATILSAAPFNQAAFYNGEGLTTNFTLADQQFRELILAKAMANISGGTIPEINAILLSLFPGRGNCYVADGENMTLQYTFTFELTNVETAIVAQSNVLPKPVGVLASIVYDL